MQFDINSEIESISGFDGLKLEGSYRNFPSEGHVEMWVQQFMTLRISLLLLFSV
jgi:hypothetical protein